MSVENPIKQHVIEHLAYGSAFTQNRVVGGKAFGGGQIAYETQATRLPQVADWDVTAAYPAGSPQVDGLPDGLQLLPFEHIAEMERFYAKGVDTWSTTDFIQAYQDPDTRKAFLNYLKSQDICIYSGHLAPTLAMADGVRTHIPTVVRMHSMLSRYRTGGNLGNPDFAGTVSDVRVKLEDNAILTPGIDFIFSTDTERRNTAELYANQLGISVQELLQRFHHVPLGFDHFEMSPQEKALMNKQMREKLQIPLDAQVAYLMGRRDPPKLFHHVLEAFMKAYTTEEDMKNAYLCIFGGPASGEYEEQFQRAVQESQGHVILAGAVSPKEGHAIDGACIIPGPETFSFVMGEAGIAGNALAITADCPELHEITAGLEGTKIINPSSSEDMLRIYAGLQNGLMHRAQDNKRLGQRFTWDNSIHRHAQVLEAIQARGV